MVACGPGLKPADTREVGRDALAAAAADPEQLEAMLQGSVVNGGLWFENAECATQFGTPGEVRPDQFSAFARCLATLRLEPSARKDALGDVVVMQYAPGFEIEARVVRELSGPRLAWIGFESQRDAADRAPTITVAHLESLRVAGDPHGPLDPAVASTLELDATPTSQAAYSWIKLCLDDTGSVNAAHVHETTSVEASRAFVEAVQTWRFRPFTMQGQPLPVCAMVRLAYPPDRAPPTETLPLPPPPSRSKTEPIVFAAGAKKVEGRRIAGNRLIVPDRATQRSIRDAKLTRVIGSFRVCIDETGQVESVLPLQSTGFARYDRALVAAMYEWRYSPYQVDDQPVPVCTGVTFIFTLR